MKYLIIALLVIPNFVRAGQDRGGGDPTRITESSIKLLLEGNGLKNAMLSYLDTLRIVEIDEGTENGGIIKTAFFRMLRSQALKEDMRISTYAIRSSCMDALNQEVPASTEIGALGGEICFDTAKLTEKYKNLNAEEVMIQLASLAFHEHTHHFQTRNIDNTINEREAYLISAYVQITAKLVQVPLLKWEPPKAVDGCDQVYTDRITAIHKKLEEIAPEEAEKLRKIKMIGAAVALSSATTWMASNLGLAANLTNTAAFSTLGYFVGMSIGESIFEPQTEKLKRDIVALDEVLKLLREARIGGGAMISDYYWRILRQTERKDISPLLVARTISDLNERKAFCKDPISLYSVWDIIGRTIRELQYDPKEAGR